MDAMLAGILLFALFLLCGIKSIILKKRGKSPPIQRMLRLIY